jgi:hypothetical protein
LISKLNREPITMISSSLESGRRFVRLLVLLATVAVSIGAAEWLNPSSPPLRGKFAWAAEATHALLGTTGLALLWFVLGAALILVARFVWRHTPKVPADRWLW